MANAVPNSLKAMLWKGQISATDKAGTGSVDVFKIILMAAGFSFNKDAHHCYADVSAYELPTGNGYAAGGETLTGVNLTIDDVTDQSELTFNDVQWDVSGANIVVSGAILYDDTTDVSSDDYTDAIISYKDANGDITVTDGTPFVVSSIKEIIKDA